MFTVLDYSLIFMIKNMSRGTLELEELPKQEKRLFFLS